MVTLSHVGRALLAVALAIGLWPVGPLNAASPGAAPGPSPIAESGPAPLTSPAVALARPSSGTGYVMVQRDGYATAIACCNDIASQAPTTEPIVGLAVSASLGAWLATDHGGVITWNNAPFLGSPHDLRLAAPIVGIAATPDGRGYWLVGADGGVFTFGDAKFHGAIPGEEPVGGAACPADGCASEVGLAPTPTGGGYWLAADNGGVVGFGDAAFFGALAGMPLAAPMVSIASTPDGRGYWLLGRDGGVFAFGDALFAGSLANGPAHHPAAAIVGTPSGHGYWVLTTDGGIFTFGDAPFYGNRAE